MDKKGECKESPDRKKARKGSVKKLVFLHYLF